MDTDPTKTVLIADDEAFLRRLVAVTLGSGEYRVVEAADGEQAWARVRAHRPQLALLDVMMPGRSGLDVARAIRSDPDLAGTRVIMLSALASEAEAAAGLAAGADLYLTKPFSPLELRQAVQRALGIA